MSDCEIIAELRRQHERYRGSGTRMEQVLKNAADALTRLRLTDAEREALEFVVDASRAAPHATLRKLLARLS